MGGGGGERETREIRKLVMNRKRRGRKRRGEKGRKRKTRKLVMGIGGEIW